mgnify:CR=1 FL=1
MRLFTKRRSKGSVRLAYKNGLTNALIRTMLFCRKFYGARSKFGKIAMNQNNVSKTQMLSHVRHYFEALFYPVMKSGDMCGTNA